MTISPLNNDSTLALDLHPLIYHYLLITTALKCGLTNSAETLQEVLNYLCYLFIM